MKPKTVHAAALGDADALKTVRQALKVHDPILAKAAARMPPAEAAKLLLQLKPRRAREFLQLLPDQPSLAVLQELEPHIIEQLLDQGPTKRLTRLLGGLPVEEAADFLAETPEPLADQILEALGRPPELVAALDYRAETAGAVMRRRLVAAPVDWTIEQVIAEIRQNSDRLDRIYAVYAIDAERKLVGFLKVRDLLLSPLTARVGEVMRSNVAFVSADTDRADVVRLAEEKRLPVLPVVNAEGVLVGRVTAEELQEIVRAEADEDMKLMSGLAVDTSPADGPLRIVPRRLPWLAGGLIGAFIAALVVGSYEDALAEAAILASLIPIVMSLAGNAGIQASTVTVQAMTSGAFWAGDLGGRLLREIGGALLNGGCVGLITLLAIQILALLVPIQDPLALGLTAGLTLIVVTVQATAIGSMVPVALNKLGFDPAVATGVFITTSNDVIGVLVFFLIASAIYL